MKRLIYRTSVFVFPFIALYTLNILLYDPHEGDLVRLGYLYSNPLPKSYIRSQYHLKKHYTLLSEIELNTKRKFDLITIGDSFSEQDSLGYGNSIGSKGLSVLHIDGFISEKNPLKTLVQLLNSGFFNTITADHIVLQSVERSINRRTQNLDLDATIDLDTLSDQISRYKKKVPDLDLRFFTDATFKIPLTNIQYHFSPKPKYSQTYRYRSNSNDLFSNSPNDLLFYQDDIDSLGIKNDPLSILRTVKTIESISDKVAGLNMKLVMLVSPDKYDMYYPYIEPNTSLNKPLFFETYGRTNKKYLDVDAYKLLSEKIRSEKDVYFYDDTHWSPKGAKIIADGIYNSITK